MANALKTLFTDIANAIRSKTGEPETVKYKPIDFPTKIGDIKVGSDEDVEVIEDTLDAINGEVIGETLYTVTFIGANGETLCQVPVYEDYDCPDPSKDGTIETPTKESTTTQVFTHSGWSLTDGGSADNTALSNVTGDRTVYAAFTETVRTYTVRFFDDETLLTSKRVEYGVAASYTGTMSKENYLFTGWNPEPSNVTEDMDCYAVWEESQAFSVASWDLITVAVNAREAQNIWSIGDEKDITLTWEDGSTETCTLQIADFDEKGTESNGKPYMTLISKGVLSKPSLGPRTDNNRCRASNVPNTKIYEFLQNTVKPALPKQLASALKVVNLTSTSSEYSWGDAVDLYIPHKYNVGYGIKNDAAPTDPCELADYLGDFIYSPLYDQDDIKRIKKTPDGTARSWWMDGCGYDESHLTYVDSDGNGWQATVNSSNGSGEMYVCIKLFV